MGATFRSAVLSGNWEGNRRNRRALWTRDDKQWRTRIPLYRLQAFVCTHRNRRYALRKEHPVRKRHHSVQSHTKSHQSMDTSTASPHHRHLDKRHRPGSRSTTAERALKENFTPLKATFSCKNYHDELVGERISLEDHGMLYQLEQLNATMIRQLPRKIVPLPLQATILAAYHATPLAGHTGIQKVLANRSAFLVARDEQGGSQSGARLRTLSSD